MPLQSHYFNSYKQGVTSLCDLLQTSLAEGLDSKIIFLNLLNDLEVAAREGEGVSCEVTKSVISLYVDNTTKWVAVIWRKRDKVMFKESIDRVETWSRD